jgi:hypothetical protein
VLAAQERRGAEQSLAAAWARFWQKRIASLAPAFWRQWAISRRLKPKRAAMRQKPLAHWKRANADSINNASK